MSEISALPRLIEGVKVMLACVSPAMAEVMVGGLGGRAVMLMVKNLSSFGSWPLNAMILPVDGGPRVFGVPEIVPVDALNANPDGRESDCANPIGTAPLATNLCVYGIFKKPLGG